MPAVYRATSLRNKRNCPRIAIMDMIYGCMNIGGEGPDLDGKTRDRAFAALDAAWEAGFRTFDHADIYAQGRSESVFGDWMARRGIPRDDLVVQSKCGIVPGSPGMYDFSRDHILSAVEGILSRLKIEYLDLLLLHRPDPLVEPEAVRDAFDTLQQRGLVRRFGVSNHSALQITLLAATLNQRIVANQIEVSLAHPDPIVSGIAINQREPGFPMRSVDLIEYCRLNEITVQAWSPLARGRFSGASNDPAGNLVRSIADRYGVAPEAIVLAWLRRHPARIQPVVGSTNPGRITAAAGAESVQLTRMEWYALLEAARGAPVP